MENFSITEWNEWMKKGEREGGWRRRRLFAEETLAIKLIRGYLINYGERTDAGGGQMNSV